MKKIIVGNWKMFGDAAMAHALVEDVAAAASRAEGAEVVVCPPAILIPHVVTWLVGSNVKTGGQDCNAERAGAFTGDISAAMLAEAGCGYVIVGHSERRQTHYETNEQIRQKAARAIEANLIPIICVGESGAEREAGRAEEVVERQVEECIPINHQPSTINHFLLAYEPVWAIGSGKTPTTEDIRKMHTHIQSVAAQKTGLASGRIPVLYGGSVKAANAGEIMAIEGVSGVLVGGASLKAGEFTAIIAAIG